MIWLLDFMEGTDTAYNMYMKQFIVQVHIHLLYVWSM